MNKNRILKRLKIQAFSTNISIGTENKDIEYLLRRYNQDDDILKILKIAEAKSNSNHYVNMKNKYRLSIDYRSKTMNKSVFVTTDINAVMNNLIDISKIYVWDIFILELVPEYIHNYILEKENIAEEQNKTFDLQKIMKKLNKIRYIISVLSYPLSNPDQKNIVFDMPVLQSNIDSVLENIFTIVKQHNSNYKIIQDTKLIQKIKDSIQNKFNIY